MVIFSRVLLGFAIGFATWTLYTAWHDIDPILRGILCGMIVVHIYALIQSVRTARWLDRTWDQFKWDLAASTDDPIRTLARFEYFDSLSREELEEFRTWTQSVDEDASISIDDAPPVVAKLWQIEHGRYREQ